MPIAEVGKQYKSGRAGHKNWTIEVIQVDDTQVWYQTLELYGQEPKRATFGVIKLRAFAQEFLGRPHTLLFCNVLCYDGTKMTPVAIEGDNVIFACPICGTTKRR